MMRAAEMIKSEHNNKVGTYYAQRLSKHTSTNGSLNMLLSRLLQLLICILVGTVHYTVGTVHYTVGTRRIIYHL